MCDLLCGAISNDRQWPWPRFQGQGVATDAPDALCVQLMHDL